MPCGALALPFPCRLPTPGEQALLGARLQQDPSLRPPKPEGKLLWDPQGEETWLGIQSNTWSSDFVSGHHKSSSCQSWPTPQLEMSLRVAEAPNLTVFFVPLLWDGVCPARPTP